MKNDSRQKVRNNMADVELVIKIDEKLYKDIYSDAEIMIYGGMRSGKTLLATLLRAIRNGTPLPKGHGRLIDADELELDADWDDYYDGYMAYSESMIKYAPTIIDADRKEQE